VLNLVGGLTSSTTSKYCLAKHGVVNICLHVMVMVMVILSGRRRLITLKNMNVKRDGDIFYKY